ncbi:MAG TPA: adenylate/guanylate cyclase domain-containing protein [Herpetosiphonaceae bacterium]
MTRLRSGLAGLHLITGLALLLYAFTHLVNHAVGIFGINAIERARLLFLGIWRSPLLFWVVPVSLLVHLGLALRKLLTRKTYRGLKRAEWLQLLTGLAIPVLLTNHIYRTRVASTFLGVNDTYAFYLTSSRGVQPILVAMLTIVWLHGCLGLHGYLRQKAGYERIRYPLQGLAIILPILALAGIIVASREALRMANNEYWIESVMRVSNPRGVDLSEPSAADQFVSWYVGLVAAGFAARAAVLAVQKRRNTVRVEYLGQATVPIAKGATLLEASLQNNLPHAHVCGGRGRCSTCRVQIIAGGKHLAPPDEAELRVLKRIGAARNVRLACQAVPQGDVVVRQLLPPDVSARESLPKTAIQQGTDKEAVILFADLRGFTALSEHKLPYDTVFILNQYFQTMGQAIEAAGGYLDKFIGDGIMALFGLESDLATGCRQALDSAAAMAAQLDTLNIQLKADLDAPLQIGIGIHCGHVVVGEMGYKHAKHLTAIGDAVNIAARLEQATKELHCQLLVSREVVEAAGADFAAGHPLAEIEIRGRSQSLAVYSVLNARQLAPEAAEAAAEPVA